MPLKGRGERARIGKATLRGRQVYIAKQRNVLLTAVLRHRNRSPDSTATSFEYLLVLLHLEAPRSHSYPHSNPKTIVIHESIVMATYLPIWKLDNRLASTGFGIQSHSCLHNTDCHPAGSLQ